MSGQSDRSFWIFNAVVSTAAVGFLGWLLLLREGGGVHADLSFMPGVNAALNAMTLQQILGPTIPADCQVAYGVYDIGTRQVLGPDGPGLTDPPASFAELEKLAVQVAKMDLH